MKREHINKLFILLLLLVKVFVYGQTSNVAPILTATGNQVYCPGSSIKIVTSMSIIDPDDPGVAAVYIQISSGYVFGQDTLMLTGSHPTITSTWNMNTGKLTLSGISSQPTYSELIAAIEDVEYSSSALNPSGSRTFSISIGQANYLPSNGHYYQYIPNIGVTWSNAKNLAQSSTYYGLQGYLATITAADEAQLSGAQAAGAGWIGGSDEQTEGVWKWMTGPEIGTIFWNGGVNGSTTTFAFWNNGEPNNMCDEDYTHVTAPGVGVSGSWNDLSNTGDASGDYQPKGYIVEYGGMPGDPVLHISTNSTITIPSITSTTSQTICGTGSVNLQASANIGTVNWYANASGGTPIATGNNYTTPSLNATTIYYVDAFPTGCTTGTRTAITATINSIPVITVNPSSPVCGSNSTILTASTTSGLIYWYDSITATNPIGTGTSFTTPILSQNTTYYVEGNNNGCLTNGRTMISVIVYPLPVVTNEDKVLCENNSVILDAGLTNVTYLWSTNETTKTITVTSPGTYTVAVTSLSPQNCSNTKTITVIQHNIPIIQEVVVEDSSASIIVTGFGDFEYSIDGINYQNSNVFIVADGGLYTAFVREKYGCGTDYKPFIIITIPKFFTPNNDGNNDTWTIKGLVYYPQAEVTIFDRFGKLISQLNANNFSWDGTLNGKILLSDDYWYVLKTEPNSPEVKGHFSMKR